MRVSVAIPTKNRTADLVDAVESLLRQSRLPDEVVIVDQSDTFASRLAVERLVAGTAVELIYVHDHSITGTAAAKNVAVQVSRGDLIVFIDDDVILDVDCLDEMVSVGEQAGYDGIGGIARQRARARILDALSILFHRGVFRDDRLMVQRGTRQLTGMFPTRLLSTCLAGFRRQVFEKYDFDETLTGYSLGEDVDFSYRASKEFKFVIAPNVRGYHRLSSVNRLALEELFESKSEFYAYFFTKNVPKTSTNILAYVWVNTGLILGAVATAIGQSSLAPVTGVARSWRRHLSKSYAALNSRMSL